MSDDYSADRQTTGTVMVGGSVTGEIETAGDQDWFAVELEAGVEYRIDLEGSVTAGGTLVDPWLRWLHDADGAGIRGTRDDDGGEGLNARQVFTPTESGIYYISANGAQGQTGSYTLSVTRLTPPPGDTDETPPGPGDTDDRDDEAPPDPPIAPVAELAQAVADLPADTTTTGAVTVGGSVTGAIETARDRDWFAVELEAGGEYRIDLKGAATDDGTLGDPVLRGLHDAVGVRIAGSGNNDGGEGRNAQLQFTATESGVHYIAAASNLDTGSYTLSVTRTGTAPEPDDHGAGPETAGTVAVGGSVAGAIETARDRDWFAVELEAGGEYRIDLKGAASGDGTLGDPVLHGLHDAAGAWIAGSGNNDGGEGRNAQLQFTATESGVHYIAAASNLDTGSYTLSVTRTGTAPEEDDPGDAPPGGATDTPPGPGDTDDGRPGAGTKNLQPVRPLIAPEPELSVADAEGREGEDAVLRFRVTLDRAAAAPVTVSYATADGTAVAGEDYEAASGTLTFAAGETELTVEVTIIDDAQEDSGETFTLRLSDPSGASLADAEAIGTIVNSEPVDEPPPVPVSEPAGEDLPADTTTTGRVVVGGSAMGDIQTLGEHDWFKVDLEAGTLYRIDLEGITLDDPYLRGIHDSNGDLIPGTENNSGGPALDSRVYFTPDADGTYYLATSADLNFFPPRTGTYRLSVTQIVDDRTAGTDTSGSVAVGGSVTGEIELPGDRDWFAVTLEAGTTYRIELEGEETDGGTLVDPKLYSVYDSNGNRIVGARDDNSGEGLNSRLFFMPDADGTYYIAADGVEYYGIDIGTYTLSVTESAADDYSAHAGRNGTVAVDGSVTGNIERPRDTDWFAVTLEARRTYWIDIEGSDTDQGTLRDPYLRGIYDSNGDLMPWTWTYDGGVGWNSRLAFIPEADGTYYVNAGAVWSHTGTYRLSVTSGPTDGYSADTDTIGRVAVGGHATGRINGRGDEDWFKVDLEAGTFYRIDLEGRDTHQGTLHDPHLLGIYDSNGALIPYTEDGHSGEGFNSRVFFAPDVDGAYYIAAGHKHHYGTYTLFVTATTITDDHSADTDTSGTVAVGGSTTGEIDYQNDRDWFAVELEAGKSYRIDLEGADTDRGTLPNPYLHGIHDSNGDLIPDTARNKGGHGLNSRLSFSPDAAGTYYIAAGVDWGVGTYEVSVEEVL